MDPITSKKIKIMNTYAEECYKNANSGYHWNAELKMPNPLANGYFTTDRVL